MMIFSEERLTQELQNEASALLPEHWEEVALNKDKVRLDIDWDRYYELQAEGKLFCMTIRDDTKLVGYYVAFCCGHPHYKSTRFAFTDIYYLEPGHRRGRTARSMIRAAKQLLKNKGVQVFVTVVKLHRDRGVLFELEGFRETERTLQCYLGD
jgi:hypothetical protein